MTQQQGPADPLICLFFLWDGLHDIPESVRQNETDRQQDVRLDEADKIEKRMIELVPKTAAGAVALTKLLLDFQTDSYAQQICDNLITGLEGMDGG